MKSLLEERLTVQNLEKKLKGELKKEDEVPIVTTTPSIEDIRQNATDIVDIKPVQSVEELIEQPIEEVSEPKPMPNKFFNFLEDESANMSVNEYTPIETKEEEPVNISIPEPVIEVDSPPSEEIEMLDFLAPEENIVDIKEATDIIENAVEELKTKGYNVTYSKDDSDRVKYIIEIDKN